MKKKFTTTPPPTKTTDVIACLERRQNTAQREEETDKVIKKLEDNKDTTNFFIAHAAIDATRVHTLTNIIISSNSLIHLSLVMSNIGDEAGIILASILAEISSLRHLSLFDNNLSNDTAIAIAFYLEHSQLSTLSLGHNNIGDIGLIALGNALKNNYALFHLDINNNPFSENALNTFSDLIRENYIITSIRTMNKQRQNSESTLSMLLELGQENHISTITRPNNEQIQNSIKRNVHFLKDSILDLKFILQNGGSLDSLQKATIKAHLPKANTYKYSQDEFDHYFMHENQNYNIIDVPKDGNCFFYVVAMQTRYHHHEIRERTVNHIRNHLELYSNFLRYDGTDEGLLNEIERYINNMNRPGTWADNIAIQALADSGFTIHIFEDGIISRIGPSNPNTIIEQVINIEYIDGNHFRSAIIVEAILNDNPFTESEITATEISNLALITINASNESEYFPENSEIMELFNRYAYEDSEYIATEVIDEEETLQQTYNEANTEQTIISSIINIISNLYNFVFSCLDNCLYYYQSSEGNLILPNRHLDRDLNDYYQNHDNT